MPECHGWFIVQVNSGPISRMVTAPLSVQADLSNVVHSSYRDIFATSLNHKLPLYISLVSDQKRMKNIYTEHRLIRSHSICLPSLGSPSPGDPENMSMQLPHNTNSPWLARTALVLGFSAALNGDSTPTASVNNTSPAVTQPSLSQLTTS